MPFFRFKDTIEEGDLVIVYINRDNMTSITVDREKTYNNRYGLFTHKDMIGKRYGTMMSSSNGKGFIHLLFPTPELWSLVVPHRTQILYQPDISYISSYLDLKPGKKMIESGTGSGSFSHSIARSLAPNGHLYSFEFHEKRFETAKAEFEQHGISDMVTIQHRDVCKLGFGLENEVDAVFLDLPAPWEAIPSARTAFRQNLVGKLCSFSPCIEQVQRTCEALSDNGFTDICMFEVLVRNHDIPPKQGTKVNGTAKPSKSDAPSLALRRLTQEEMNYQLVTKTPEECRGHTSYLTFATFIPDLSD
ncbi:tRNA methyltransferase complex GCD14 subunit-domain-containing protein [Dimargaris cristalligena]|uniref:tRNA (adenine(58)-N(1))-methyltransferase catalytic subunit TRM61 n=1 Tax=Dimargaris cristalligena TaxID=215637 RepID=A0A4Q0A320_9FUNG|nr:tRNA methyltransferase complex GCD14 subunit-domain-containing protein [Dimargaris cristalligena]|eukprot:RKP40248.1 tRNA methyltransferase complex GCD14 subunit-domain-containing protein [Dimargaris cristalligena]